MAQVGADRRSVTRMSRAAVRCRLGVIQPRIQDLKMLETPKNSETLRLLARITNLHGTGVVLPRAPCAAGIVSTCKPRFVYFPGEAT